MGTVSDSWTHTERANVERVREILRDVFSGGNLNAVYDYYDEDAVLHFLGSGEQPTSWQSGASGLHEQWTTMLSAFPDLTVTPEQLVADGDRVVAEVTVRGTHRGEFRGFAPTGNTFEISGFFTFAFEDGLVVEEWNLVNALGMLRQIGLFPDSPRRALRLLVGRAKKRFDT